MSDAARCHTECMEATEDSVYGVISKLICNDINFFDDDGEQ